MASSTRGNDELTEFLGMLFTVTADGKVAIAEFVPAAAAAADGSSSSASASSSPSSSSSSSARCSSASFTLRVTAVESEWYDDDDAGTREHFFDVELEDAPAVLNVSVCGTRIKKIVRLN